MTKKILVTGCAGFIGSNLVDKLLLNNCKVIGIDNLNTGKKNFWKMLSKIIILNLLNAIY